MRRNVVGYRPARYGRADITMGFSHGNGRRGRRRTLIDRPTGSAHLKYPRGV